MKGERRKRDVAIDMGLYRKTRDVRMSLPLGEMIALTRKDQGMSQERLGEAVGYSQSIISRMETGTFDVDPSNMAAIAVALNSNQILNRYCYECSVCEAKKKIQPKPAA
ncbi:helix-turn-helix transcriptional regulator [bacterium]|nr:MAG: helix-turn-helix transcriptional regulator [bacterium]